MLDSFLKLLAVLLPFLKEMLIGDDNITDVFRKNKVATVLFFANLILFTLLLYMTSQAFEKHWQLESERGQIVELKEKIKEMLPAGVEDADTVVEIARRISTLEQEKQFYATTLNQVYGEMDELTEKMHTLMLRCVPGDTATPPAPRPHRNTEIETAEQLNRERTERLRALLDALEENQQ